MTALPAPVLTALSVLTDAGFEAFIVGGCVRDALLGRAPSDYDVTTNALPAQVAAAFSGFRVVETGLKHGTLTVLIDGMPLEITTYRVDLGYSDGRHPDRVAFTPSLADDLARRDFTVNAMAWSPRTGTVDPFGGQADLGARVLRCVGEPALRFGEDALRILRLLRFGACFGFSVDAATAEAAHALRGRLALVSAERIQKELDVLLRGDHAAQVLAAFKDVLFVFLPELERADGFLQHNPNHAYDVLTHLFQTVANAPDDPVVRLAALLHDVAKPDCFTLDEAGVGHFRGHAKRSAELTERILTRLRFDNAAKRQVTELVSLHDVPLQLPPAQAERAVRRLLGRLGEAAFFRLLALKRADTLGQGVPHPERLASLDQAAAIARRLLAEQSCVSLRELAVRGDDLLAAGIPQGKAVGEALQRLLEAVIDGRVPNERNALLRFLKES